MACHLHIDADPDPACHVDADPDPDPTFQFVVDPRGSGSPTLNLASQSSQIFNDYLHLQLSL